MRGDGTMARLQALGLAALADPITPDPRLVEPRVIVALTHRAALARAAAAGISQLLVLEEGCLLHRSLPRRLPAASNTLRRCDCAILGLGGLATDASATGWDAPFEGAFALLYSDSAIAALLALLPAEAPAMADWIAARESYEAVVGAQPGRRRLDPPLASLPALLPYEDPAWRNGFLA